MSFYTSLTGLNSATAQLGVTSNNIANVGTTGFKRSRADFGDIFATSPLQKASSTIGQGVALKQVTQEFGQGNVAFSANALDLAITGDGFFPLKSADGLQDIYTRNGSFMMNDQYNVVNSAGQRLMAASVDSSGKADLGALNVLTIPQKTTGEAGETSLINLGLNFPADATVITEPFNRANPETYNKSTALTVYDSGGNGYLATVYYAKTQNASQTSPFNKWQTYVFVGDTQVNPSLIQATDDNSSRLFVNKYGEIKPESEVSDFLVNGKTQMFALDDLTDKRSSTPASIAGQKTVADLTADTPFDFSAIPKADLKNLFSIDVDSSGKPVVMDLSSLAGTKKLTGVQLATAMTNKLNEAFGDERYFDFTGNTQMQLNTTIGGVNSIAQLDLSTAGATKQEKLTFTAADADGGDLRVGGVSVTTTANETAISIAAKVKTALEAAGALFDTAAAGQTRTVTDPGNGTLTLTWAATDGDASAVTAVAGTSGVTVTSSTPREYVPTIVTPLIPKKDLVTFSAPTTPAARTITVGGVAVLLAATDITAADVAAKVVIQLNDAAKAFQLGNAGRSAVDNGDGTVLITWGAADEDAAELTFADTDPLGATGVTRRTTVDTAYAAIAGSLTKVTKDQAAIALKTQLVEQGLTTVAVAYDSVTGGFKFTESGGGAISLQVPQTMQMYNYVGTNVLQDEVLGFELKSGSTTVNLSSAKLKAGATLNDLVTALTGSSNPTYASSGYTISNAGGKLVFARDDGASFTIKPTMTSATFGGTLKEVVTATGLEKVYAVANADFALGDTTTPMTAKTFTENKVLGVGQTPVNVGATTGLYVPVGAALNGQVTPNGDLIRAAADQRYGIQVKFDNVNEKFTVSSGTTGDTSSIAITNTNARAKSLLGLEDTAANPLAVAVSDTALRGTISLPAQTTGTQVAVNVNNNFSVDTTNNKFVVSVDDVKGTVSIPPSTSYTLDGFMAELQKGINNLASTTGSTASGVKVTYDRAKNAFQFTTGTTGTDSFIKVSGSSNWGLANVEAGRGASSTWIKPTQFTDYSSGVGVSKYIDEFGVETASADGYEVLPEWSPIFLDKGELTFNTSGNLISPKTGSQLDTVYLDDGKGALTINIDYSASTQYSSAFAVLSQSQDGKPEGDLVGLDIGDDGLVSASYSNGSQLTLAKVILSNFSSPAGLRQIGDSSFYATAKSGAPKIGEAGSAGFGTIRAGATERANVDLTQELVDLITAQRNFQANAKAIETSTTMTQAIIQIRT